MHTQILNKGKRKKTKDIIKGSSEKTYPSKQYSIGYDGNWAGMVFVDQSLIFHACAYVYVGPFCISEKGGKRMGDKA
ncbi:restriction endonuclease subunit [Sesbania bispinosa]|nr:restriction endonuclease subunit [Sesbania bispinosa]